MDVAIDTGADAPAPTALELTAPADTPAYLSTHDAPRCCANCASQRPMTRQPPTPRARTPLRRSRVKNRPLPMQRTTPLLWMHRIPAQRPKALIRDAPRRGDPRSGERAQDLIRSLVRVRGAASGPSPQPSPRSASP